MKARTGLFLLLGLLVAVVLLASSPLAAATEGTDDGDSEAEFDALDVDDVESDGDDEEKVCFCDFPI